MATNTYKRLGASTVTAATNTKLYESPAGTTAIVSSILVCNRDTVQATFRIAHVDAATITSVAGEDYLYFDTPIPANDTFVFTGGLSLDPAHCLLVRANTTTVNFIAWGAEIS